MEDIMEPIVMKLKIVYWGDRSGMIYKDGTLAFKTRKWGNGKENSGRKSFPSTHRMYRFKNIKGGGQ